MSFPYVKLSVVVTKTEWRLDLMLWEQLSFFYHKWNPQHEGLESEFHPGHTLQIAALIVQSYRSLLTMKVHVTVMSLIDPPLKITAE